MKRILNIGLITLFLITFACDPGTALDSEANELLVVEAKTTAKQTVEIFDVVNGVQAGSSTLHRNSNGITVNFKAEGLIPGHTYTLWWVIWNYPDNCANSPNPCDEPDFGNPVVVGVDVLNAGGHLAGNSGKVNISAHLKEGDTSKSIIRSVFNLADPIGLIDAQTAEVHPVLRSHGPAIPGMVNEQIGSYLGGCTVFFDAFTQIPLNEGECGDIYAAIHQAE